MTRRGYIQQVVRRHREAERRFRAQELAKTRAAKEMERIRRAQEKEAERIAKERQRVAAGTAKEQEREAARSAKEEQQAAAQAIKERERLHLEERQAWAALQTERVEQEISRLQSLLHETLSVDDALDFSRLRVEPDVPLFAAKDLEKTEPEPVLDAYLPKPLSTLQKLIPGATARHARETKDGRDRYEADRAEHAERDRRRQEALERARIDHEADVARVRAEADDKNAEVDTFEREYAAGAPQAIIEYCLLVLEASIYPESFPRHYRAAYVPESRQLVVEAHMPPFGVIPEVLGYKHVKAKDEIAGTPRPAAQRKTLYQSVIAQIAVRTLHELFEADRHGHLDTIVYSGFVDTIDRGTGQPARPCLVTVRTTRDVFQKLNLAQVDPVQCLKTLSATVSKSPAELVPVRPMLEFNMVDPRFVEETDVLSTLDSRPNLMELSPSEFEALISNLFARMGLETRLTQASRDGGVDCVAYDPRPIFGGKVVIQAKRYKNTVGVSAVRDLYGTLQNEGASKGILVTTSGYGKLAFKFAEGKPLELLSGSHLLHLLAEHAGIEAKIEAPEEWRDPATDLASGDG